MLKKLRVFGEVIQKVCTVMTREQKMSSVKAFLTIILASLLELLGVTIIVPFIGAVMGADSLIYNRYFILIMQALHIEEPNPTIVLIMMGILLILIYTIKNICLIFSRQIQNMYQIYLQKEISVMMLKAYLNHPYEYFINTNSAEIIRGVEGDVVGFANIVQTLFSCLAELLTVVLILGFVLTMDFMTSIGLVIVALLCVVIIVFGCKNIMARIGMQYRIASIMRSKYIHQIVNGIKEIFVMQKKSFFLEGYEASYDKEIAATKTYMFINSLPERIIEVLVVCGIVVIVCVRIVQGYAVEEYISQLAAVAVSCFRLLPSLGKLTSGASQISYYMSCLDAVYDNTIKFKQYTGEFNDVSDIMKNSDVKQLAFERTIEINDITWRYINSSTNVLDHLSLKIDKGESVALIGESGAGKSTLADIVMGLLYPQQGSIQVDTTPISQNYYQWSQLIGYVPQSVYLIDDTIRNNIAFGIPQDQIKDEVVWSALEQARLDRFISNLPHGLDTIVGERGIKFSGGQRQRIAIARAMYYDPEILVLDEATSALDDETERAVMESIDSLQGKKTLIIIAHRLSTIQKCDKIYEVVDRNIVERNKSDIIKAPMIRGEN